MKSIQPILEKTQEYKYAQIQKQFISKKHLVAYVLLNNKPFVIKSYQPGYVQNMHNEYKTLLQLTKKLTTPHPYQLDNKNNIILMTYISGKNLCDQINSSTLSINEKKHAIEKLGEWMIKFHKILKKYDQNYIHGDATLRNFIINERIWGVDFEETRIGNPQEDIADLCTSILTTNPMFTQWKFPLCIHLLKTYSAFQSWKKHEINQEIAYSLLKRIQWRPKDEELFRKYAQTIRKKGLEFH